MVTVFGGLSCRVFPEEGPKPEAVIVMAHGFGAPGDDLVPLRDELVGLKPSLTKCRFIFPAAPVELGGGARAWWMIDSDTIARLQSGEPSGLREFRKIEPVGMAKARALMLKLVDEVRVQTGGVPIILGGFSQGAMLATDIALRLEERPRGLAILSGTLLVEDVWRQKAKARAGLRVLQSHGRQDPILAFMTAEWLRDVLIEGGLQVEFLPFDGGHGIPMNVLVKLAAHFDALLHDTSEGDLTKIPT